ncbi:MAG: glycosyltransferase [Marinosulfonomonas sp.]|nr:glycosyltransferase [Marinosulfonomonas sp.]
MPTNEIKKYAVVIPHYDDVARLRICLDALCAADLDDIDVVVVDNGSLQGLSEIIASFQKVRFLTEPRKGAANARNRGVSETNSPYLFFLDSDCVPAQGWLSVARSVVSGADIIGGRIDVFDETAPPRSGPQAFEAVFGFDQQAYIEAKGFSVTANLLTSRKVFEDVGPFRSGVSEDLDWCLRAGAKGYKLSYEDRLCVGHPSRGNWRDLSRKWRRLNTESFSLTGVGPKARIVRALRALVMPISILAHAPKVLRCKELSASEKLRGLGTLAGIRMSRMIWMLRQAITGRA